MKNDINVPIPKSHIKRKLTPKEEERYKLIEHMLSEVEEDLLANGKTNEFIESLREWFDVRDTLTEKQVEALEKFYDRL